MNHITKLQSNAQITREWVAELRAHLGSAKFQGTEVVRMSCGNCLCSVGTREERKDWISTADVLRQLDALEATWLP